MSQLRRERTLANSGPRLEPEHSRSGFLQPASCLLKQPRPSGETLRLFHDARFKGSGLQHFPQFLQFTGDASVLLVSNNLSYARHTLGKPRFPVLAHRTRLGSGAYLVPVLKIMPLDMANSQRWFYAALIFCKNCLNILVATHG